jgi:hypothetical protein
MMGIDLVERSLGKKARMTKKDLTPRRKAAKERQSKE